jgi:polysaccharide biosynthesis transport protein
MTTLPQTTPMRLPRSGAPHIAIPGTGPMAPAQPQQHFIPSTGGMTGADVWRVIRTNLWLIFSMLIIFGIAGFLLNTYLLAKWPHYEASGLVQINTGVMIPTVSDTNGAAGGGINAEILPIEMASQVKEMLHTTLLGQVLADNEEIRRTTWFQKFVRHNPDGSPLVGQDGRPLIDTEAAKEDLATRLTVLPYPNSKIIIVSATCTDPNDCRTLIEAVVNEHITISRTAEENIQERNQQYFHNLQSQLTSELGELAGKIQHLSMDLGTQGEDIGNNSSTKTFELQTLLSESLKADEAATEAQDKLDLFNQQLDSGIVPPEVEARYESNPAYWDYRRELDEAQIAAGSEGNANGAGSPMMQGLKQRVGMLQQKLDELTAELKNNAIEVVRTDLESELKSDHDTQAQYKKKSDELQAQIAQISTSRNELEELRNESREKRETLQQIQDKLDQMTLIQEMAGWGTVDWADGGLPDVPSKPVFPRLSYTLPGSLMLGLALALGIAFLREMTDTTVRSPRDIARVGNLTVLGMIPHSDDDLQSQAARLPLVIYDAPHSMVAEQFRQVRTRLHHAASLDTTRSILVTGCGPGDGKTTVAANIAAGLALNGRRILLVDANFRRPDIHNIFSLSNELGFGDVLGSVNLFEQAVRETEVPNLSVIVNGTRPSNPTELLESQLFVDFIERALEEFDHVIFDSGPLLIVSETIAMAPRVDGVMTVIRARTNSRGMLSRMRDQLRQLKAEHLGIILNAVRSHGGGYYGPMIKAYYAYQNGEGN